MKRGPVILLTILIVAFMMAAPTSVSAASEEPPGKTSLIVHADYYREGMAGPEIAVYRIGDWDAAERIIPQEEFRQYEDRISFNCESADSIRTLAITLAAAIAQDDIPAAAAYLPDAAGKVTFENLEDGVWLVVGTTTEADGILYTPEPALVALPLSGESAPEMILKYDCEQVTDETVSLHVVKIWQDDGRIENRPQAVTVVLLENGRERETVQLDASCSWRHTWTGLRTNSVWTVAERDIPSGYTVRISREGRIFAVTNTPKEPVPTIPVLPQTGIPTWQVPLLVAIGLVLLVFGIWSRLWRKK